MSEKKEKYTAVVLAAGKGTRMGGSVAKQFLEIGGKPVVVYALEVFEHSPEIDRIILVTGADKIEYCQKEIIEKYGIKKRIIHAHNSGNETSKLRGIFHYLNKTRLSQYATDYWSCSMVASEYFYNENIINSPKHHIINNAIQTKDYAFDEAVRNEIRKEYKLEDKYVIGHVGRFQYQKNHEFLVDVFNEYLKLDNKAVLMLVGQGEGEEAIRQKVADLGMTENVMFMGVRSDVNKLLQAMDIFVLPSHFEGLPLVLVEAQSAGLPCYVSKDVITKESDVTGNIEFISLDDGDKKWAQIIYDNKKSDDRNKYTQLVIDAGFDINTETNKFINYIK